MHHAILAGCGREILEALLARGAGVALGERARGVERAPEQILRTLPLMAEVEPVEGDGTDGIGTGGHGDVASECAGVR